MLGYRYCSIVIAIVVNWMKITLTSEVNKSDRYWIGAWNLKKIGCYFHSYFLFLFFYLLLCMLSSFSNSVFIVCAKNVNRWEPKSCFGQKKRGRKSGSKLGSYIYSSILMELSIEPNFVVPIPRGTVCEGFQKRQWKNHWAHWCNWLWCLLPSY